MKKTIIAAAMIASAMSAPAFANGHDTDPFADFTVALDLEDMILVRLQNSELTMGAGTLSIDRLEADVGVSIEMRGAGPDYPRPYKVTLTQDNVAEGQNFSMNHEIEGLPSIAMSASFYPSTVIPEIYNGTDLTNGVATDDEDFITEHGITKVVDGEVEEGDAIVYDSMLALSIASADHMDALPGSYDASMRLMVEAR